MKFSPFIPTSLAFAATGAFAHEEQHLRERQRPVSTNERHGNLVREHKHTSSKTARSCKNGMVELHDWFWHDEDSDDVYFCQDYADYNWCGEYGEKDDMFGITASQACCACGGGNQNFVVADFPQPTIIKSSGGKLTTTIKLEEATHTVGNSNGELLLTARHYNGEFPGPTLMINQGETLDITLENALSSTRNDPGTEYHHNSLSGNDETNLHFHGLWVSGEGCGGHECENPTVSPGDDVLAVIKPGQSKTYSVPIEPDHMPGTHWYHPHRHGSSSIQVMGGAVGALIIKDLKGTLPKAVETARDVLFLAALHHPGMECNNDNDEDYTPQGTGLPPVLCHDYDGQISPRDSLFRLQDNRSQDKHDRFVSVNGHLAPTIQVYANEWIRLRVLWTNLFSENLDLQIAGCEMQLLAKDGIYIQDFPRTITRARIPPGGRADIMLRCSEGGNRFTFFGVGDENDSSEYNSTTVIAHVDVYSDSFTPKPLDKPASFPEYPSYMTKLTESAVSSGCDCVTRFRDGYYEVNGVQFREDTHFHQTYIGAVNQRTIYGRGHPYHQHNFPFQIVVGFEWNGSNYNTQHYHKPGDWGDSVEGDGVIRYKATKFPGKMILHCHMLYHEDMGMMAYEMVEEAGTCTCIPDPGA